MTTVSMMVVILGLLAFLAMQMMPRRVSAASEQTTTVAVAPAAEAPQSAVEEKTPLALPAALELARLSEDKFSAAAIEEQQIIQHIGYTLSYSEEVHLPWWVAYELSAEEVDGVEERSNHFKPDPLVKGDPVVTKDYSNSGYDRGHMALAADMKWSEQAMRESFYMTNMCPQVHNLNAGDWKVLEEFVRSKAKEHASIYVCCGPLIEEGYTTIGEERKIVVPQAFYKVILRRKSDNDWSGIGFIMKNAPRTGKWTLAHYAVTIEEVEQAAGIDFFYALPDDIEERVELSYSLKDWGL